MTLRRFINRDGWERWLDVEEPPPRRYYTADQPRFPQGFMSAQGALGAIRSEHFVRREFDLVEWVDSNNPRRTELVYVEDYDTSLLHERSQLLPAQVALAQIASIIDVLGDEGAQLDRVSEVLCKLPLEVTRRSATRCFEHGDCRRHPHLGQACAAEKRSADQPK